MDLFDLTGKTAVVTGGTRGIGLMIARGLLQAGASKVYVSSRKAEGCEQAERELTPFGQVQAIQSDLSAEAECLRLAREVGDRESALHVLVNNAGATWGAPLQEFPGSAWDKVLDLNLKSPFFLTRAFRLLVDLLRHEVTVIAALYEKRAGNRALLQPLDDLAMLIVEFGAAGTQDDPARVINVGSIDGLRVPALPTYSYSASKAGLHHLTRVLAKELGPRHITVNAIAPGPFESKMMAATLRSFGDAIAAAAPLRRIGRPDDMAGAAVFLSSRAGSYVTGAVLPVDGGIATTV